MSEDLKKFVAVLAQRSGPACTISFNIEDDNDALEFSDGIALIEGTDLFVRVLKQKGSIV